MDGFVVEPIAHRTALPGGADPPLVSKHPQSLRDSRFRPTHRRGEVTYDDARPLMQHDEDLQSVWVGQQVEPGGPRGYVHVAARRGRDVRRVPGGRSMTAVGSHLTRPLVRSPR